MNPPATDSIDSLLETVLQSLDANQAALAVNGTGLIQFAHPAPDSGAEYDFRYLREFCASFN
jgi:hypothetical protein